MTRPGRTAGGLAAVVAAAVGGCTCAATPEAPDWGGVALEVGWDGGPTRRIARDGVVCRGIHAEALDVAVHTADDAEAAAGGWWSLWIHADPPEVWWSTRASRAEATSSGPTWVARSLDGVRASGQRIAVDVHLDPVDPDGGDPRALSVRGEVRCPTVPDRPPPDAVDALLRAAPLADELHVDGGRAWIAVPPADAAAALDRVRAALPDRAVAWVGGGADGDRVQLVVASGSRPTDIVRWAGVGIAEIGLDPVDVAVRAEGLSARFGLDLVAADSASITLRVPPAADRGAVAAALADVCPDAVAAQGGVDAVDAALAADPVAVCGWR